MEYMNVLINKKHSPYVVIEGQVDIDMANTIQSGYVGLVTAIYLAENKHSVTCIDIDENKIAMLNSGKTLIFEDGLEELMQENKKRLKYKMDYKSAYKDSNVIITLLELLKKDRSANVKSHLPYENNGIDEFLLFIKKHWTNCSISDILMVKTVNL